MKKFLITALCITVLLLCFVFPCYASEDGAEATEAVTMVTTDPVEENATEAVVEGVEATEEEVTTVAETEPVTEPVGFQEGFTTESDRDWLINAIKNAKPEEVEAIKGYIEDAVVHMEGLNYTEWDWVYKIVADNAEWFACLLVGIGFVVFAVVSLVLHRRKKILINNSVETVQIAEQNMAELVKHTDAYEATLTATVAVVKESIEYMKERDERLCKKKQELIDKDEAVIEATKNDVNAMLMLADIIDELIQLSAIPQVRKDAIYSKHATAKNHIVSQMQGGDSDENQP